MKSESTDQIAERLRVVFRLMKRRVMAVSGDDGPTQGETSVMAWLDEKGTMTPSVLSAAHHVRPQTMGQTLDLLAGRGWITRAPHSTDRRQVLISLTPSGRRALARGRKLRQAWLVAELTHLPANDRRVLSSALTILESFLKNPNEP
jgi:DNA-binding MarR family transcriptional regulator